jgi:hypothetical protein
MDAGTKPNQEHIMSRTQKTFLVAAAVTGLMTGFAVKTLAQATDSPTTASASACACRITGTSCEEAGGGLVEIISENFMVDGGRPLEVLDQILEQYRVVQHGVSMYFGSADKFNREHLKKLKTPGQAHQDAVAVRSSLLGQRGWTLHARLAADALHVRRGKGHGAQNPRGARFSRSADPAWRTSAATPNSTRRK